MAHRYIYAMQHTHRYMCACNATKGTCTADIHVQQTGTYTAHRHSVDMAYNYVDTQYNTYVHTCTICTTHLCTQLPQGTIMLHTCGTHVCVMHTCTCVLNTNMDNDPHVLHKTTYAHRQTSTPLPMRAFTGSSWVHPTPPSPFTRSGPGKPNPKSQGNKESLPRKVGFRRCSQPGPSFVRDTEAARVGAGVDGGGNLGPSWGWGQTQATSA